MARFLLHCFLLAAPVLGMVHWLNAQIKVDYAWAMDYCQLSYFNENHDKYEVVLFGSSHFGRQLSPVIFDSIQGRTSNSSFLFAFDQLYAPLNLTLLENLTNDDSFRPSKILFELAPVEPLKESKNLESTRVKSWYTLDDARFYFNSSWEAASVPSSIYYGFNHLRASFGFLFSGGIFWEKMATSFMVCGEVVNEPLLLEGRSTESEGSDELIALHDEANQSDSVAEVPVTDPYVSRLNRLAQQLKVRGTCFVLVIPPRLGPDEIYYLRGVGNAVSGAHFVDLSSALKYPQFYRSEWVFDNDHLNSLAVPAFTAELAKAARSCNN